MEKFWFVWNSAGRAPTFKHLSKTSAKDEAKRLAGLNPGDEFHVLESIGHFKRHDPIAWKPHEASSFVSNEESIPF